MKKILILFLLLIIFPFNTFAVSKNYEDKTSLIVGKNIEKDKINLYLFYGEECPHCEEERAWLKKIQEEYEDSVNIYYFEVWHNNTNVGLMDQVKDAYNISKDGVPLTIIGKEYYVGFSETIASMMENQINSYIDSEDSKEVKIPILGNINLKNVSIPVVAIVLGFVDGFNPCAMWILLFLISMLLNVENKKRAWILGLTFLFGSAFVYFLSMLGINFVVGIATINYLKIAIAIFILIAGILNIRKYLKQRKQDAGCNVVSQKKRKKIMVKMKNIIESKSFIFSLFGILILAISVNLIELACSLGFPLIFTEILSINNITGVLKIIYLLLYILFYMIDDIFVFGLSMITMQATGITNKYNKLCTLISGIIMLIMGLLLIFKPDWLMLNF